MMIGPGGLLLVVSHLFAVLVSVSWMGLQKSKYGNLDVKNIFAGSRTKHRWRCSLMSTYSSHVSPIQLGFICLDEVLSHQT